MEIREIMQALDSDPSLLEELRARILTRELLEMPENLARLTQRVDALTVQMDNLTQRVDALTEQVGAIAISLDTLHEASERRFERMSGDIGILIGAYAEQTISRQAVVIAGRLGRSRDTRLRYQSVVASPDLLEMAAPFASEIDQGDLDSFYVADLVMRVRDDDADDDAYIAVEASYTCDTRDTARAIRNVRFIERFTGKRAYAAVAGIRMDSLIRSSIDAGDVFWHQLEEPR
jgi:hypothetical protein